jgi:hypothetical protein
VVVDAGVVGTGMVAPGAVGLVCARPDAHLVGANARGCPVLLVGEGPLPAAAARRLVGGNLAGVVPWSARVARAGAAGRVPSALPGAWLRELRGALRVALRDPGGRGPRRGMRDLRADAGAGAAGAVGAQLHGDGARAHAGGARAAAGGGRADARPAAWGGAR